MENLNDMHLDVLREIGNIGAGNAATSLSKILNRRINMDVPEVKIIDFKEVEKVVGGVDVLVVGIYLEFLGDIQGTIMYILDEESVNNLLSLLIPNKPIFIDEQISPMGNSALKEIANILAGAYLGSLAKFTGLSMRPTVPAFAFDMAGAILSVPMIEFGEMGEQALFIETIFIDGLNQIKGNFFLIPNVNSYPIILKSLGVI